MSPCVGLAARAVAKSLGGRRVLDGASLTLDPGEVVVLRGANGAGKTTLLRILAGALAADEGEVSLTPRDGAPLAVTSEPLARRARMGVGYLPQEPSAFLGLRARENLAAVLELRGHRPAAARERATRALDEHGLGSLADQRASTLSGGERRRLELARLLVLDPSLLLLDEPFRGLDRDAAQALGDRLRALGGEGRTVLLSDHAFGREAEAFCTRTLSLEGGRVVEGPWR